MLITIGADCHMKSHTLVAVDPVGRNLGQITVGTNTDGHLRLLTWAEQFDEVIFALEDCRHVTRRLERDLLRAGQKVLRVPTKLMGEARRIARQPGKSDPIDAEAVAIAALRHPDLPTAQLDGPARDIKLLSDHRRDLVMQRTRACCQIRWFLHELDPDLDIPARGLRHHNHLKRVRTVLASMEGTVARLARELTQRIGELNQQIAQLDKELTTLVKQHAPALLEIPGCGVLSAALIVGETAGVERFRNKDAYARFTGTAPVPVWSGSSVGKVRLNRGGNRQMNWALHMIAVTQARGIGPGKDYLTKQQARGKDRVAGLRLLRRRLSDTVFAALRTDAAITLASRQQDRDHGLPAAA